MCSTNKEKKGNCSHSANQFVRLKPLRLDETLLNESLVTHLFSRGKISTDHKKRADKETSKFLSNKELACSYSC